MEVPALITLFTAAARLARVPVSVSGGAAIRDLDQPSSRDRSVVKQNCLVVAADKLPGYRGCYGFAEFTATRWNRAQQNQGL